MHNVIIDTVEENGKMMVVQQKMNESMFRTNHDIPWKSDVSLSRIITSLTLATRHGN